MPKSTSQDVSSAPGVQPSLAIRLMNGFGHISSHVLAFVALILVWQIASLSFVDQNIVPSPREVFHALFFGIPTRDLLQDIGSSLRRVLVGLTAAIVFGVVLGLILGPLKRVGDFISAVLEYLRPIPPIAWIPIAILWFGIGEMSAYFIIFLAAFFPIFTNTFVGARSVSPVHRTVAHSLSVGKRLFILDVLLPTALPQIVTGVRIGAGFAWMAVIASEMVAAQSGLGYMIQLNRLLLMSDKVVAGMVVIGVIGYLMNRLTLMLGDMLTPWRQKDS